MTRALILATVLALAGCKHDAPTVAAMAPAQAASAAVSQPAQPRELPEPGTLLLVALGVALVMRRLNAEPNGRCKRSV